jgi:phage terminase large subunit-like protein
VRAEPVHQLYQEGKVHHVGRFLDLEKELCTWQVGQSSPNRLDAMVWGISALMEPSGNISVDTHAIW